MNNTAWRLPENIKHRPPDSSPLICCRCLLFTEYEIMTCFSLNHGSAKKQNNPKKIRHHHRWTVSRPDPGPARFDSPPSHQSTEECYKNLIPASNSHSQVLQVWRGLFLMSVRARRPHAQLHLKWQYDERCRNNCNHPALFWSSVSSSHL